MYELGGSGRRPSGPAHTSPFDQIASARSSTYGIQPIWPSAKHTFRFGCRASAPQNSQSVNAIAVVMNTSVAVTGGGASGDDVIQFEPEPMCMNTTVSVSAHAANSGSQCFDASCTVGRPTLPGSSLN